MELGTLVLWSLHLVAWDIIFSGKTQGPADIGLTPDTLVPWPLPLIPSDCISFPDAVLQGPGIIGLGSGFCTLFPGLVL